MEKSPPPLDRGHLAHRPLHTIGGLLLLVLAALCAWIGNSMLFPDSYRVRLDVSQRPSVLALFVMAVGGIFATAGTSAILRGIEGRILRYKLGDSLPPNLDAACPLSPEDQDFA